MRTLLLTLTSAVVISLAGCASTGLSAAPDNCLIPELAASCAA